MKHIGLCLLSFFLGLPNALAWAKYVAAITAGDALMAALWDGTIVLLGVVGVLTVWEWSKRSTVVLLCGAVGGMVGTYLVVGG